MEHDCDKDQDIVFDMDNYKMQGYDDFLWANEEVELAYNNCIKCIDCCESIYSNHWSGSTVRAAIDSLQENMRLNMDWIDESDRLMMLGEGE